MEATREKMMIPQLNTSAFVRSVIRDMRLTDADPTMKLDMGSFAFPYDGICHACAGGSAVIHGMGGSRWDDEWTEEQECVARWCEGLRLGNWDWCSSLGYPVPEDIKAAYVSDAEEVYYPGFWKAWEAIAAAFEAAEARGWDPKEPA